jgi:hypothetical protein
MLCRWQFLSFPENLAGTLRGLPQTIRKNPQRQEARGLFPSEGYGEIAIARSTDFLSTAIAYDTEGWRAQVYSSTALGRDASDDDVSGAAMHPVLLVNSRSA